MATPTTEDSRFKGIYVQTVNNLQKAMEKVADLEMAAKKTTQYRNVAPLCGDVYKEVQKAALHLCKPYNEIVYK